MKFSLTLHHKESDFVSTKRFMSYQELVDISNDLAGDELHNESAWYMARAVEARKSGAIWVDDGEIPILDLSENAWITYESALASKSFPVTLEYDEDIAPLMYPAPSM